MSTLKIEHITNIARSGEDLSVDTSGQVGVGTISPADKMHIYNASGTTVYKAEVNANSIVGFGILKTGSTNQEWAIADGITANGKLQFYDSTDSAVRMQIDGSGFVGIGPNTPTDSSGFGQALDVNGTNGAALYLRDNTDSKMGVIGQWNEELSIHSKQSGGTIKFYINNSNKMAIDSDGVVKTAGRGITIDNSDASWTAVNVTEASNPNMALIVSPHRNAKTKGFSMGSMGAGDQSGLQTFDTSNNTANDFLINPYGGVVGVGADGNLSAKFTVNKPATGHTTGYQEDIAQLYTTETTYLGRHYMNFFHDNQNRDASGHHTVWGMAFGYDNNTRGGIQYDHKGQERMTLWSSYGSMQFKLPATAAATKRADEITEDPALELKTNGNNLRPRQSAICLTSPSSQSWASGNGWVKVNLTTVVYQKGNTSAWDSSNGRYVCPETGLYLVTTSIQMENNSGATWRYLFPCINGSTTSGVNGMNFADFVPQDSPNATYYHHTHSCILRCSSGDYIEWKMTGSGGGHTIKSGGENACCIYFLG